MIPFHVGALYPQTERYLDRQYRTVARRFRHKRLDYDDALCLSAFLSIVPVESARWVFLWDKYGVRAAQAVVRHYTEPARDLVLANAAAVDVDTGLAVLRAMQEGGWTRGPVPLVVSMALRELKHSGIGNRAISKRTRLTLDQVRWNIEGSRKSKGLESRSRALVQLAL